MNPAIHRWMPVAVAIVICGMANLAAAHPPSAMDASYDAEKKNLHVGMQHVTKNPRKHFIRRLSVVKNGEAVDDRSYVQQTTATMLVDDIHLEAVTGDVLRIEAICNKAGREEAVLVVP